MTPTEHMIASALAALLNCRAEDIAVDTSFADLGLDSLSAVRLIGRIEDSFEREIDPMLVLDYPSIKTLAAQLDSLNKCT